MNTFETFVNESPGLYAPEYRNAVFHFDNGVSLSVGFGSTHYTTPRGFQGLHPKREVVELAVLDRDKKFITREFYAHAFEGRELHDDVVSEDTANFFSILRLVEEYAATLTSQGPGASDEHDRIMNESSQREVDAITQTLENE